MSNIFDHPEQLIARLQADAGLVRRVNLLTGQRYVLERERFRSLFWVLLAESARGGGRIVLAELNARDAERAANKEQQ